MAQVAQVKLVDVPLSRDNQTRVEFYIQLASNCCPIVPDNETLTSYNCPIVRGQWKHAYTFSCPRTMGQLSHCPGTMKTYIHVFLSIRTMGQLSYCPGDNENMHIPFPVPAQWDSCPIVRGQWKHTYTFSCPRTMGQLSYCRGQWKHNIHLFLSADNGTVVLLSGDNENMHTPFPIRRTMGQLSLLSGDNENNGNWSFYCIL